MNIPSIPRYDFATNTAYEFLIDNKLTFISDIIKVMEAKSFKVISFTDLCNEIGWDYLRLQKLRHTSSAITRIMRNGQYHVWFNELTKQNKPKSFGELRFDLAHELGHIELGHLRDFNLSSTDFSGETVLEREADCFARNLLEPVHFISMLRLKLKEESEEHVRLVQSLFHVTESAAKVRCVGWLLQSDYRYTSKENRQSIVELLMPRKHWFTWYKKCRNCGYETLDQKIRFCSICGESDFATYSIKNFTKLQKERGKNNMIYPGVDVDENGKALRCPHCDNQKIQNDGEYCDQCGSYLINKCADERVEVSFNEYRTEKGCGHILKGNQRFCPYCGHRSTFLINELLEPWNVVHERLQNKTQDDTEESAKKEAATTTVSSSFEDPFINDNKPINISDDDLPF